VILLQPCLVYTVYHSLLHDWFSLSRPFCGYCIDLNVSLAGIITIISQSSNYLEGGQGTVSIVCTVRGWNGSRSRDVTNQLRKILFMVAYKIKYLLYSIFIIFDIYIKYYKSRMIQMYTWAGIARSVQRLATGWTARVSNSGGGEIFRSRPDRPWALPNRLCKRYLVFPRGKSAGAWRWPPTSSNAEVKERAQVYLYSPYGPSWPVPRWT